MLYFIKCSRIIDQHASANFAPKCKTGKGTMTVYTHNNIQTRNEKAPDAQLKADGTNYKYRMFFDNGAKIIDSDSLTDIIHSLIRGYNSMTEAEQLTARRNHMRGQQFNFIVNRMADNSMNMNLKEWEKSVLSPETLPVYGWGDGTSKLYTQNPELIDFWSADEILLLIESDYLPHGKLNRPLSSYGDYKIIENIHYLRTENEFEFLESLTSLEVIHFGYPITSTK